MTVFITLPNSMVQVILLFYPKLAVACVLVVITSRVNIARSVASSSQMPQTRESTTGQSYSYDEYVGTYSQAKRSQMQSRSDRSQGDRGEWPVITQTGSLGLLEHPILRGSWRDEESRRRV